MKTGNSNRSEGNRNFRDSGKPAGNRKKSSNTGVKRTIRNTSSNDVRNDNRKNSYRDTNKPVTRDSVDTYRSGRSQSSRKVSKPVRKNTSEDERYETGRNAYKDKPRSSSVTKREDSRYGKSRDSRYSDDSRNKYSGKPGNRRVYDYYDETKVPHGARNTKRVMVKRRDNEEGNHPVRLNKFIADAGVASRRKADELIERGEVKVNGRIVTELGTLVTKADNVTVNGDPVSYIKHFKYILLNKPKDYITTTSDEKNRKTVMDIVKSRDRIYPVGRLDRNTTGVLLLTNDGDLANRLMHPKYQVERTYNVGLDKRLRPEDAQKIADGVELEDGLTSPCELLINPEDRTKVMLTLKEGKNREVRRIFEFLGYNVVRLDRKSYAGITTRGLERGDYRHLTKTEVMRLKNLIGL